MRSLFVLALLTLAGCSSKSSTASVDEYIVDCTADGGQFASDESFIKFIEAESAHRAIADACKSPELVAPGPSGRLDTSSSPIFSFHPTHVTCSLPQPFSPKYGCVPPSSSGRGAWKTVIGVASDLLVATAEAHCGAFTGENYLFRLYRSGESTPIYTALLSVTSFTPDTTIWQRVLSGRSGQSLALTIEKAGFLRGSINEGPYVQPQPYAFTVGP